MKSRLYCLGLIALGLISVFVWSHWPVSAGKQTQAKAAQVLATRTIALPGAVAQPRAPAQKPDNIRAANPLTTPAPRIPAASSTAMGMTYVPEPLNGQKLALAFLNRVFHSRGSAAYAPKVADFGAVELQGPLPVYDLPVVQIQNGGGMEGVQPTSYLYVAENAGDPFASVEVLVDDSGAATKATRVSFGENEATQKTIESALAALANNSQVVSGHYEPRLLRQVAKGFEGIWLKSENGGPDLVYAFSINPNFVALNVEQNKIMTMDDFLSAVRTYIQADLNRSQIRQGGG
jgi:hypothetical protein